MKAWLKPRLLIALFAALAFAPSARAVVTNIVWYRLGENDPGAANGVAVTNTTTDVMGFENLKQFGGPIYTNGVSTAASNDVGSSLALQFNGTSQYLSNTVVTTMVNNFGIEAWVKPDTTVGAHMIAYNGNPFSGMFAASGWGIIQNGNTYSGQYGGVTPTTIGSGTATAGTWTHLALVSSGGTATFYVNGVAAGSKAATPISPSAGFAIGANPQAPTTQNFSGSIDEVRVFTFGVDFFGQGLFSTNDLLVNLQRVTTLAATGTTFTSATLNGSEASTALPTSVWFQWGTTTNYGNVTSIQLFSGSVTNANFSQVISSLLFNTTYHFRAAASNSLGVATGADQSFTTPGPSVQTLAATGLGVTTATLNGATPGGSTAASVWFQWGATTNYGNLTPVQAVPGGGAGFSQAISNLVLNTTYQFSAVLSNGVGVVAGTNLSFTTPSFALAFTNLPGVWGSAVAWGDYDNDGRLDLLITGQTNGTTGSAAGITQVWRNTGNGFSNINAGLPGVSGGAVAWGDYDNDGRLDILLTGVGTNSQFISQVWRNTGGGFSNINAGLPGVAEGSVAWGDYDNDGRLDILLSGFVSNVVIGSNVFSQFITQVWRNTSNGFVNINAGLTGLKYGSVAWGDYDNDGRLDILLMGLDTNNGVNSQVWRNTGGGFVNINAGFPGVWSGSSAWGDYDNDGRLDVLLTGAVDISYTADTELWRNTGSGFTRTNTGLPGNMLGSAAWGDFDNDGRSDIAFTGITNLSQYAGAGIWRNTVGGFINNPGAGFTGTREGCLAVGDYDGDGRLDVLVTGSTGNDTNGYPGGFISQVWRNVTPITNTPPTAPTGLTATPSGTSMVFSWNAASDAQTPAGGLTYNLRVGTTPDGGDIVSPMSAASGLRRVPQMGNMQCTLSHTLSGLPLGQAIYWSVQAVDNAFAGSPFAPEQSFAFNTVLAPPNGIPVSGDINGDGVVDQNELNQVLSNYYAYSPYLLMTNVAGLGGTNVTFALSNSTAGSFSVEYSTNLTDWLFLGPATPLYQFIDTNAPAIPQRYYRLRWP